jgi:hypothetical protein
MDDLQNMIQRDIERLEEVSNRSLTIKERLINKLSSIVEKMKLDPDKEDTSRLETKVSLINSINSLLTEYEKQFRDTVKAKAKINIDNDMKDNLSTVVTSVLKEITNNIGKVSPSNNSEQVSLSEIDEHVESLLKEKNIDISKEETSPVDTNIPENLDEIVSEQIDEIIKTSKEGE